MPQPLPPRKAASLLHRQVHTRARTHTHRHTGACQILVFLIYHGQSFSSKQRPFVLPLPDHRDHWEAEEGGWQAH